MPSSFAAANTLGTSGLKVAFCAPPCVSEMRSSMGFCAMAVPATAIVVTNARIDGRRMKALLAVAWGFLYTSMMKTRNVLWLLLAFATQAFAVPTTSVVDIASRGGTQRILYVVPDAPRAFLIHVPGGDGVFGIQPDGSMGTLTATCSPVNHRRQAFTDAGIGIAFVDAHSSGSVREYA